MNQRPTLTIAVLTHNEESQIEACLRSAAFADQLLVVDSGSTDKTVSLAQSLGAEVHSYPQWQGFAVQRNRLLAHSRCDWVFFLDADETVPPELQQEILQRIQENRDAVYEVTWMQVAFGKPLRHLRGGHGIPRLFPMRLIERFEGVVHERALLRAKNVPYLPLRQRLMHYSRRSVHQSLLKLAQYAQLGAAKRAQAGKRGGIVRGFSSALSSFVRTYFINRGFMCGPEGFLHCFLVALESFFRYAALKYDAGQLDNQVTR